MTWVPIDAGGEPERDAVLGLRPDFYAHLREILGVSWQISDPALLDLCRLRLAQLDGARAELAALDSRRLAEVERWPDSGAFGARERSALTFTEQYHVDHHVLGDELEELGGHLGERGLANFVWALHMNDAYLRALSLLDIEPDPPDAPPRPEREAPTQGGRAEQVPDAEAEPGADLRDPAFLDVYFRLARAAVRRSVVDELTSESIRLNNANFQSCRY
jgi:hypothetical protein